MLEHLHYSGLQNKVVGVGETFLGTHSAMLEQLMEDLKMLWKVRKSLL